MHKKQMTTKLGLLMLLLLFCFVFFFDSGKKNKRISFLRGALLAECVAEPVQAYKTTSEIVREIGVCRNNNTCNLPSYRPSPDVAHVDWMYHLRLRIEWRPSLSVISATDMALGRSCLLAKTSRTASRSSSSLSILLSSSHASVTRSRSLLSTTKIRPCVFWK